MKKLLFGTAGTPHSSKERSSISGISRIKELGLDCMELEFVRGVKMGESTALNVLKTASELKIELSVHAPYYINLNSRDHEKYPSSLQRIKQSAIIGNLCGARDIVFHCGFYMKSTKSAVYQRVKKSLEKILSELEEKGVNVCLRPETTGKRSQFGSLKEILRLSLDIDGVAPCIDFSHLHARNNRSNSREEFAEVLSEIENTLGRSALKDMHIHLSGIEYTRKGEKNHLNLEESDLKYIELLSAWKEFDIKGRIICESPNLEEDALLLKRRYEDQS